MNIPFVMKVNGGGYPKYYIDIVHHTNNIIIYENVKFFQHLQYKEYYFSHDNSIYYIKKESNEKYRILESNKNKKEGKRILMISSKYCDENGKYRKVIPLAKAVLETISLSNGLVCSHIDDNVDNNLISNLIWMTQPDNIILFGINYTIGKKLFIRNNRFSNSQKNQLPEDYVASPEKYIKIDNIPCIKIKLDGEILCIGLFENFVYNLDFKKQYKLGINHKGYMNFKHKKSVYFIHNVICWAKYGEIFKSTKEKQVIHNNDDQLDNSYNNIIIGSFCDNRKSFSHNFLEFKKFRILLIDSGKYTDALNEILYDLPLMYIDRIIYLQNKYKITILPNLSSLQ